MIFLNVGTPSGVHLFDQLLWSIFQSSITHYIKQFSSSSYMFHGTFFRKLSCTASTPVFSDLWVLPSYAHFYAQGLGFQSISTICQSAEYILELYIHIQIWINLLLIFIKKFSSLPGFEPGTSSVPSRYASKWAILAWISQWFQFKISDWNCKRSSIQSYLFSWTFKIEMKVNLKSNFKTRKRKIINVKTSWGK